MKLKRELSLLRRQEVKHCVLDVGSLINLQFDDLQFTIYVLFNNLAIYRAVANSSLFTFHFAEGDGERDGERLLLPL